MNGLATGYSPSRPVADPHWHSTAGMLQVSPASGQLSLRCCPPILEGQLKAGYLDHIGVKTAPPHITPARGPPLWDGADAQAGKGVEPAPDWGQECQAEPDFEVDQRISW